jgi:eukaryotic-like serine/threonine-protein kinase
LTGIFISYRRRDSPDATGRIYDCLVAEFGKIRVFKDVDSIPLGQDFREHLNDIVGDCGVMLAIIGPGWIDSRSKSRQRRLEDSNDFVRIELEAALARGIPVVPVLVGHAPMPLAAQLPPSIASMVFRQSIEVRPDPDFHNDATRLVSALRGILEPAAAAPLTAGPVTSLPAATISRSPYRLAWFVAAGLGLIAAALAIPAIRYLRETSPVPPPETRTDIITPAADKPESFALSPDGRQIVFVAAGEDRQQRLWLRSLSATTAQPLTGTEGARLPFWSPDSRSVGFFASNSLQRLDLGGGTPRILAAAPYGEGGAWSTGGVIVFGPSPGATLSRIPATGGAPVAVTKFEAKQLAHGFPVFLPDGRHFLFAAGGDSVETGGTYLAALGSTDVQRLTSAFASAYLPGWLLWIQQGDLDAQRFDVERQRLTGDTVTIAAGVAAFSVSTTGLVAYRARGGGVRRQLTWFDRVGKPLGILGEPDDTLDAPSVSPDGRRAAVIRTVQKNAEIWLLEGTRSSRLTFAPVTHMAPVWSPDGRSIAFGSTLSGSDDVYWKSVDGSGNEELLVASPQPKAPTDWSRDGRFLLYFSIDPQTHRDLWVRPMTGDQKPWVFLKTQFEERYGQFSPDGRFVAYQSNESGLDEIYIRPFTPPREPANPAGGQWQISTAGGIEPRWSVDGTELYYLDPAGRMMAVSITVAGAAIASAAPVPLFATKVYGGGTGTGTGLQYAVARDGRFLINTLLEENRSTIPITLIQNWQPPGK